MKRLLLLLTGLPALAQADPAIEPRVEARSWEDRLGVQLSQDFGLGSFGNESLTMGSHRMLTHSLHGLLGVRYGAFMPGIYFDFRRELQTGRGEGFDGPVWDSSHDGKFFGLGLSARLGRSYWMGALVPQGSVSLTEERTARADPSPATRLARTFETPVGLRVEAGWEVLQSVFVHITYLTHSLFEGTEKASSAPERLLKLWSDPMRGESVALGVTLTY